MNSHVSLPKKSKIITKIPAWFIVFILAFTGAMVGIVLGSKSLRAELDKTQAAGDTDPTAVTPDIEVIYSNESLKPKEHEGDNLPEFSLEKGDKIKILVFVSPDAATRKSAGLNVTLNGKDKYATCSDSEKALRPEAKCYPINYHTLTDDIKLYTITAENTAGKAKFRFYGKVIDARPADEQPKDEPKGEPKNNPTDEPKDEE